MVSAAALGAYAFSQLKFRGKNLLFLAYVALLLVPWTLTLIPLFLTARGGVVAEHADQQQARQQEDRQHGPVAAEAVGHRRSRFRTGETVHLMGDHSPSAQAPARP